MKLGKLLLFSSVFLALVFFCHALQDVDQSNTCGANMKAYWKTTTNLDKLLLFSIAFLALVIVCHALQHVECKSETCGANIEGHDATAETNRKATTKLDKLLFFSTTFLGLVVACHTLQDVGCKSGTRGTNMEAHYEAAKKYSDEKNWPMAVEEYTLAAEACAQGAIAFQQKNDAVNAIKAYMRAARVYSQIVLIALHANLLMEAIEAYKQEAQMYKQAAQLYRQANDIDEEASLHALAAIAYKKVAIICGLLADKLRGENNPIGEASARILAADAHVKSANLLKSARGTSDVVPMYKLAEKEYAAAAVAFLVAKSFDKAAKAWIQAAVANVLSAGVYKQRHDTLNEARMYTSTAGCYVHAARAYATAGNNDGATEAYQQAVTWGKITAQMYHDAGDHKHEADEYTTIAHLHVTLNKHAKAGAAFELAAQALQHAQNDRAAVAMLQEAEQAYTSANDLIAAQRVQSMIEAVSS